MININNNPTVSIVIPTYNRDELLKRAICSVLNQTYSNIKEIIVTDDCKTDQAKEVVKKIKKNNEKIIYIKNNTYRKGPCGNKNNGIDYATGDFVGILDDDDELLPDAIEVLINEYLKHPECKIIMGNGSINKTKHLSGKGVTQNIIINYKDFLCGQIHGDFWQIFYRPLIGNLRFDENLRGAESCFFFQLYKKTKVYYIHRVVANIFRIDDTNITFSMIKNSDWVAYTYNRLISMYKKDYIIYCPKRLSHYLTSKAFFEILSGNKKNAFKDIVEAYKYNFFGIRNYILFFLLIFPIPKKILYKLFEIKFRRLKIKNK